VPRKAQAHVHAGGEGPRTTGGGRSELDAQPPPQTSDPATPGSELPGSEAPEPGDAGRRGSGASAELDAELTALAHAAAGGDRRALDGLLRLVGPLLLRYCRGRLGARATGLATAEDVAQEVVLAVCTSLPRYRGLDTPFMAFAYGIARNKVADAYRSAARDRSDPSDELPETTDTHAGPEQAVVGLSEMARLMTLVDRLPGQQREIVVLRVLGEMTAEETARTIGSTPGAVRVAQHRALQKLRTWLAEES
jgi:RNA polymerase sigma-70 factor, ECF subfamily